MSLLQTRAKSSILKLVRAEWPKFDRFGVMSVAAWATMFSMVVEFADPRLVATKFSEREALRLTKDPPRDWIILAGFIEGPRWNHAFHHQGIGLMESANHITDQCNTRAATFVVGNVIFHTVSTSFSGMVFDPETYAAKIGLRVIWPYRTLPIIKPDRVLSHDDFERIGHAMGDMARRGDLWR